MALGHWADTLSIATKQYILARELEEMTGRGHVVRQAEKRVEPVAKSRGRGRLVPDRWRMRIDLRWPSPFAIARPKSADGKTSFHMRVETVSRSADGASGGGGSSSGSGSGAGQFDIYVTDGLTPAQVDAGRFDRYASDAEEPSSPSDPEVETGTRVAFLITNIDADPDQREAFWQARHDAARKRGHHAIELIPKRDSIEDWRALERDQELPARVRDGVTQILTALEATNRSGRPERTVKIRRIRIENAAELAWAADLGERFGAEKKKRMLHHVRPRGGQIQRRFDAEIPAGLTYDEIVRIAREKAALFERMKLPFLIAVHRPDADNDPRNWHLHLIYFPQPGERGADGAWTFGKPSDGVGMLRPGDIAVQLEGADALGGHTHYERRAGADLRALRKAYADICNEVLEDAGDSRRLDPRSFKAMCITKEREFHLGSAEARLNFAGVDTPTFRENTTRNLTWEIQRRLGEIDRYRDRTMAPLDAVRGDVEVADGLKRDRDRLAAELDALVQDRRELMLLDTRLDIARSSAKRVKENCEQTLERIAAGEADPVDARCETAIRARLRLAEHHLVEIADTIEPWHADLEGCRRDLERRDRVLGEEIETFVDRARGIESRCQEIIQRIRKTKLHVHVVGSDINARAEVIDLPEADQATLDDPRVRASAQAQLKKTAHHQRQAMDRVLEAVRDNGLQNTMEAKAGISNKARADARLFDRYRSHLYLNARLDRAEAEWGARAIRDMEAISEREATMVAPASKRPSPGVAKSELDRGASSSSNDAATVNAAAKKDEPAPAAMPGEAVTASDGAVMDGRAGQLGGERQEKREDAAGLNETGPVTAEAGSVSIRPPERGSPAEQVDHSLSNAATPGAHSSTDADRTAPVANGKSGRHGGAAVVSQAPPESLDPSFGDADLPVVADAPMPDQQGTDASPTVPAVTPLVVARSARVPTAVPPMPIDGSAKPTEQVPAAPISKEPDGPSPGSVGMPAGVIAKRQSPASKVGGDRPETESPDIRSDDVGPVKIEETDAGPPFDDRRPSAEQVSELPPEIVSLIQPSVSEAGAKMPVAARGEERADAATAVPAPDLTPSSDYAAAAVRSDNMDGEARIVPSWQSKQVDPSANVARPGKETTPSPPMEVEADSELTRSAPTAPQSGEPDDRASRVAMPVGADPKTENPILGNRGASIAGDRPGKSIMDIARQYTRGRQENPATKDPQEKPTPPPNARDGAKPHSPIRAVLEPTDRPAAKSEEEDWFDQQMALQGRKDPKGR